MKHLYDHKEAAYFSPVRTDLVRNDLIALLPINPSQKVLEIDAAKGDTLVFIKENNLAAETVGVDLFELPNTNQTHPIIDSFHIADIEKDEFTFLQKNYFDVIICGDVLEHLIDPWSAINRLSQFLKSGGVFIASIPNIRHHSALRKIFLKGSFKYDPKGGLFDKTHFRFFCKKDAIALLNTGNLKVTACLPIFYNNKLNSPAKGINAITFGLLEQFISLQYLVVAKKL